MKRILVAGIGNIFFGDDAFGCEVIRELSRRDFAPDVQVTDFGIRGYDLAFALTEFENVILVDATPRGEAPGTVCLMEIDPAQVAALESAAPDAHNLNPVSVIQMARTFGEVSERIYLVGCEPAALESDSGEIGLSDAVQAAVPKAVEMIESVIEKILQTETRMMSA